MGLLREKGHGCRCDRMGLISTFTCVIKEAVFFGGFCQGICVVALLPV